MSDSAKKKRGHGFGTLPVFLAAISTILGAIMFLRFGYAVGQQGIWGALLIVLVGHAITIPTALAISEIATNLKVEGGGEYFIISRSFGPNIGAAIGISLYLSQAISVAFYLIAFAQAFAPIHGYVERYLHMSVDPRMFSLPMALILAILVLKKGADMGIKMLYIVISILAVSLVMFFMGGYWDFQALRRNFWGLREHPWPYVFSIVFPAFTGMTAGVGLSGDLRDPSTSIPRGTLAATLFGMLVYILIILKLGMNASPQELATDELIMGKIAIWGPIIPIGLAAATLSSAIGSLLIAPRTLQALAKDGVFPSSAFNRWFSAGIGEENEPRNATLFTLVLTFTIIILGNVNSIASIVSQFFMVTYGALCAISFLEHLAANPSYRPKFRTKWWISLIGAVGSFVMMFMMQFTAALVALSLMLLLYWNIKRTNSDSRDLAALFKGALYQITRNLQIWLQRQHSTLKATDWRPSFIAVSDKTFDRRAPFDILRWIAHRYGFGTYFHFVKGLLDRNTYGISRQELKKTIDLAEASRSGVFAATIVSPSFMTAVAQIIQVPGISGMENNGLILEFSKDEIKSREALAEVSTGVKLAITTNFNVCVYRSSDYACGYRKKIHIWFTKEEFKSANLTILLSYIISSHPEWRHAEISVFAAMPEQELDSQRKVLEALLEKGRIPISRKNVEVLQYRDHATYVKMVEQHSSEADLVIMGFTPTEFNKYGSRVFTRFGALRDMLFVCAVEDDIALVEMDEEGFDEWFEDTPSESPRSSAAASEDSQDRTSENPASDKDTSSASNNGEE